MQFSLWPIPTQPYREVVELARHAEATGWDGLWNADHFMPNAADTGTPWPDAWMTLAGVGAVVPRLRLGTLVTGNTYRHPAVLAKMAATLDHMTGGRVVLGLGSGWQENEYRQYGIPFYTVRERLERLEETCAVIKALFSESKADLAGRFYQLEQASLEPKPLQQPLPLLVGGGGEKRTLRITARFADAWNVWGDVPTLRRKIEILDGHCRDLGRDPKAIRRTADALLFMSDDKKFLEQMRNTELPQPAVIGTPEVISETLDDYESAGVDEFIVPDFTLGQGREKIEILDRFIKDVAGRWRLCNTRCRLDTGNRFLTIPGFHPIGSRNS